MQGLVVRAMLTERVEEWAKLRGSNDLGLPTALLLLPVLYMLYRRLYCQGFGRLSSIPAGAGKQGNNWVNAYGEKRHLEATWLSARELEVLQAFGDTLLPGFEVDTKEAADSVVEQVVVFVAPLPYFSQYSRH